MHSRIELHDILCGIMGNANAYYQPPESMKLKYPCIVYSLTDISKRNANNHPYKQDRKYQITVIDKNPDSTIPDRVLLLPYARFANKFTSDNLNHFVFDLYF